MFLEEDSFMGIKDPMSGKYISIYIISTLSNISPLSQNKSLTRRLQASLIRKPAEYINIRIHLCFRLFTESNNALTSVFFCRKREKKVGLRKAE